MFQNLWVLLINKGIRLSISWRFWGIKKKSTTSAAPSAGVFKPMKLLLKRLTLSQYSMQGELWIEDKFFCYTLEHLPHEPKIPNQTAVPAGTYKVILDYSEHFKKIMPHILDVPDFVGIRFHGGNTIQDSEGCLLIAYNQITRDSIQGNATPDLIKLLEKSPETIIEIVDTYKV